MKNWRGFDQRSNGGEAAGSWRPYDKICSILTDIVISEPPSSPFLSLSLCWNIKTQKGERKVAKLDEFLSLGSHDVVLCMGKWTYDNWHGSLQECGPKEWGYLGLAFSFVPNGHMGSILLIQCEWAVVNSLKQGENSIKRHVEKYLGFKFFFK